MCTTLAGAAAGGVYFPIARMQKAAIDALPAPTAALAKSGAASVLIHTLGAVFVVARAWHAQGLSSSAGRTAGRFYGTLITLLVIAALSVLLLVRSIS